MVRTRPFEPRDADGVAALFTAYMKEIFTMPSALSPDVLLRDGQGRHFRLMLAFRVLAELADADARTLVARLPTAEMSREP